MKKNSIIFLLFLLVNSSTLAQDVKGYRAKAGTTIATQYWSRHRSVDISWKSGQYFAVGKEFKLKPCLSIITDLGYQEIGFSASTKPFIEYPDSFEDYINRFQYLTLQAALKLQLPSGKFRPYLLAGWQGGALLDSHLDNWSNTSILLEDVRSYDDGPVISLGAEWVNNSCVIPFLEAGYYRSARNVITEHARIPDDINGNPRKQVQVRNEVISIAVGVKF